MIRKVIGMVILLMFSLCVVLGSLLFGTNIESYEEFRNAKFGFPVPFVYQDVYASGAQGYEGSFPRRFGLQLDFLDKDPEFVFYKTKFVLSLIIVFSILTSFNLILRKINN